VWSLHREDFGTLTTKGAVSVYSCNAGPTEIFSFLVPLERTISIECLTTEHRPRMKHSRTVAAATPLGQTDDVSQLLTEFRITVVGFRCHQLYIFLVVYLRLSWKGIPGYLVWSEQRGVLVVQNFDTGCS
jgi:hypothetical protein